MTALTPNLFLSLAVGLSSNAQLLFTANLYWVVFEESGSRYP